MSISDKNKARKTINEAATLRDCASRFHMLVATTKIQTIHVFILYTETSETSFQGPGQAITVKNCWSSQKIWKKHWLTSIKMINLFFESFKNSFCLMQAKNVEKKCFVPGQNGQTLRYATLDMTSILKMLKGTVWLLGQAQRDYIAIGYPFPENQETLLEWTMYVD